jgi:hypothetical protein
MKPQISKSAAANNVHNLRNSKGQPLGTWLLQSITSILYRIFFDEKFFYRDLLRFG